jgi:hypothetical protein
MADAAEYPDYPEGSWLARQHEANRRFESAHRDATADPKSTAARSLEEEALAAVGDVLMFAAAEVLWMLRQASKYDGAALKAMVGEIVRSVFAEQMAAFRAELDQMAAAVAELETGGVRG